jgi:hypothetical protein
MRRTFVLAALLASLPPLAANDLTILKSSLAVLRKGGPKALGEAKPGSTADTTAMKVELGQSRWETRLAAAEWLLLAHIQRASQNPAADPAQAADLNRAWLLVDAAQKGSKEMVNTSGKLDLYRGTDASRRMASAQALSDAIQVQEVPKEYKQALLGIAIEIAVRLRDGAKMARATAGLKEPADLPSDRDRTFALMACAHGGRFALAGRLHAALLAQGRILPALHDAAVADPEAVDYAALGDWLATQAPADAEPAPDARRLIASLRLRLKEVRHTDPAQAQRIQAGFPAGWQASGPFEAPLIRQGAVAHWQKPGATPIPLVGAWTDARLSLTGYLQGPAGRRVESLDLRPDSARPGTWTGQLTAVQGAATLVLDAELQLAP